MRKPVADLSPVIRSRRMLLLDGWTERRLQHAVDTDAMHLVRRGWYMENEEWTSLWPEERHRAHVIAVAR